MTSPEVTASFLEALPDEICFESTDAKAVDFLYSIKVGGEGKLKGSRNYHLLFVGGSQLARTFDFNEILHEFTKAVRIAAWANSEDQIFMAGTGLSYHGQGLLLLGDQDDRILAELTEAGAHIHSRSFAAVDVEGSSFFVLNEGRRTTLPLDVVVVGGVLGEENLSRGQLALKIMSAAQSARIHSALCLKAVGQLAQRAQLIQSRGDSVLRHLQGASA